MNDTLSFSALEALHADHVIKGIVDPDCLWCNGRLSEFWRNVNLDED